MKQGVIAFLGPIELVAFMILTAAPMVAGQTPPAALAPSYPPEIEFGAAAPAASDPFNPNPSVITLHYTDSPLTQVLEDLARQCEAVFVVSGTPDELDSVKSKKVTLNLDKSSFWDAIGDLMSESGLSPNGIDALGRLQLSRSGSHTQAEFDTGVESGLFFFLPAGRKRGMVIDDDRRPPPPSLLSRMPPELSLPVLQFIVMHEPKISLAGPVPPDWLLECKDQKGNSLIADKQPPRGAGPVSDSFPFNIQTSIKQIPNNGTVIAMARGKLQLNLAREQMFEITGLSSSKDVSIPIGKGVLIAHAMDGDSLEIELNGVSTADANTLQGVRLYDKDNHRVFLRGVGTRVAGRATPDNYRAQVRFDSQIAIPQSLRVRIPVETRPIAVPFEVDNF
jgi:hypothetical protein